MKERTRELLKDRHGASSNNYGCPVHISLDACGALFKEAGIAPTPGAVGKLGDVLENYALMLMKGVSGGRISETDLARIVDEIG